jgi:hypothetical protein
VWDVFAAKSGNIQDGSNPSVAADFFNKYKEDIALMKALGVKNFRSVAWPSLSTSKWEGQGGAAATSRVCLVLWAGLQQQKQQNHHHHQQQQQHLHQQQCRQHSHQQCRQQQQQSMVPTGLTTDAQTLQALLT